MKIVFIAIFTEIYHEEGKARGLQALGHDVYRFDENHMDFKDLNIILKINPDVVIYAKLINKNASDFIKTIKSNGILTVSWFPDYCFDWNDGMLKYDKSICPISNADLLLIPDGLNETKWESLGIKKHCVRQEIYNDMCYIGDKIVENKDVLFIGTVNSGVYQHRIPLVNFLNKKYGSRFLHLGGHNSDQVRNEDLNNIIASVKVVIGDSLYAPNYWSNRLYETIGRGGLIIHSPTEGLESEYKVGEHFDVYKVTDKKIGWAYEIDYEDLESKIDFYLENKDVRKSIALAGMEFTRNNYTMAHRCKEVVDIIEKELKSRKSK